MTKAEKTLENSMVLKAWEDCKTNAKAITPKYVGRLRNCKATVYANEEYYILVSYNTAVAFIDRYNGICYDVLRYVYGYTTTSAQHIYKFAIDYAYSNRMTYRD